MMLRTLRLAIAILGGALPLSAQTLAVDDPIVARIYRIGMDSSRVEPLAQALMDSVGPRLTGSPGQRAGQQWLLDRYKEFGIPARMERYGTWRGWRRGASHIDLVQPRARSLEGTMLAWSPGTKGAVEAPAVILPETRDSLELERWLPNAKGKFVLVSYPQPTCRPDTNWASYATPESFAAMKAARTEAQAAWQRRVTNVGRNLSRRLEAAGASGVVSANWSAGWGVDKIFGTTNEVAPAVQLSCEDYGLVARLAMRNQHPVLRVEADAQALGEVPVFNVIGEIKGSEKPDEYVFLSAHFDSWDGGSGATDNGTGTITMLEAMRILSRAYPRPKRTIVVGHWSGEEQGLVGSRAFAADHPEIVKGLQALFNQDNGTGRVINMSTGGLVNAGANMARWIARAPSELTRHFRSFNVPGTPAGGGSDNASFACYGTPAFSLGALDWEYGRYTWHTQRDTYDKIVMDDLRNNATLTAVLAYLASEDPATVPRERRLMPNDSTGRALPWPVCRVSPRTYTESLR